MGLNQLLKRAGYQIAPQLTIAVLSSRARAHSAALVKQWGLFDLNQKAIAEVGRRVLTGPFEGMTLTKSAEEQHVGPYLLGTYESELHPWLDHCLSQRYSQIVDIGSSFGYYAVGLARRFPGVDVTAFDTDWWARRAVAEMAAANGVTNVRVERFCSAAWLAAHLRDQALILSDCEGYERHLFCGPLIRALATATVIIEVHETTPGELEAQITNRFQATHIVLGVTSRSTTPSPRAIATLTVGELERVAQEVRGVQRWLYLKPRGERRGEEAHAPR